MKAYDLSGKELFSYGKFVHYNSLQIDEGGRGFSISPLPFDIYSILAGDQKNARLFHCLNDEYLIEVYDNGGKLFRKIGRPYKRIPVTGKDREDYLDGIRGISESDRALVEKNLEMPSVKNITDRMVVDDLGNLWVETNEKREEYGWTSLLDFLKMERCTPGKPVKKRDTGCTGVTESSGTRRNNA